MSRRELREQIFKLLFRVEFNELNDMQEQNDLFFEENEFEIKPENEKYISEKTKKIIEKISDIDAAINREAKGWTTSRMGKVDLTILRLAVYEIEYDDDVPVNVAINEAVELAKKFGRDESAGFVNGVLAKFAK